LIHVLQMNNYLSLTLSLTTLSVINYEASEAPKCEVTHDNSRGVIYDGNVFIKQAKGWISCPTYSRKAQFHFSNELEIKFDQKSPLSRELADSSIGRPTNWPTSRLTE